MARHLYFRVSTDNQDFMQQKKCVNDYLLRMGIDPASVDSTTVEKITGVDKHTNRKFASLLARCKEGDVIICSEISRVGRNMVDLLNIAEECAERGIIWIQAKDGTQIENKSIGGKAILFALGLAAEIEVQNIRQRTKMALSAIKDNIKKNGCHISKNGNRITKLGRSCGCDTSAAREASIKAKQDKAVEWRESSIGYDFVRTLLKNGVPRFSIIEQFNEKHEKNPGTKDKQYMDGYSTPKGSGLSEFTLSKWSQEMAATLVV